MSYKRTREREISFVVRAVVPLVGNLMLFVIRAVVRLVGHLMLVLVRYRVEV